VATGTEIGCAFSSEVEVALNQGGAWVVPVPSSPPDSGLESACRVLQDLSFRASVRDLLWAQPLTRLYAQEIASDIADVRNVGTGGPGGHITAALYLEKFVRAGAEYGATQVGRRGASADAAAYFPSAGGVSSNSSSGKEEKEEEAALLRLSWVHLDFMGFNRSSRPGRPKGGEAQGMRALFELLTGKSNAPTR